MPQLPVQDQIKEKLTSTFEPIRLEIVDESALHEGHAGAQPGGETHWHVTMVAKAFSDKSRIEMHRMVHKALEMELQSRIHALRLDLSAP